MVMLCVYACMQQLNIVSILLCANCHTKTIELPCIVVSHHLFLLGALLYLLSATTNTH